MHVRAVPTRARRWPHQLIRSTTGVRQTAGAVVLLALGALSVPPSTAAAGLADACDSGFVCPVQDAGIIAEPPVGSLPSRTLRLSALGNERFVVLDGSGQVRSNSPGGTSLVQEVPYGLGSHEISWARDVHVRRDGSVDVFVYDLYPRVQRYFQGAFVKQFALPSEHALGNTIAEAPAGDVYIATRSQCGVYRVDDETGEFATFPMGHCDDMKIAGLPNGSLLAVRKFGVDSKLAVYDATGVLKSERSLTNFHDPNDIDVDEAGGIYLLAGGRIYKGSVEGAFSAIHDFSGSDPIYGTGVSIGVAGDGSTVHAMLINSTVISIPVGGGPPVLTGVPISPPDRVLSPGSLAIDPRTGDAVSLECFSSLGNIVRYGPGGSRSATRVDVGDGTILECDDRLSVDGEGHAHVLSVAQAGLAEYSPSGALLGVDPNVYAATWDPVSERLVVARGSGVLEFRAAGVTTKTVDVRQAGESSAAVHELFPSRDGIVAFGVALSSSGRGDFARLVRSDGSVEGLGTAYGADGVWDRRYTHDNGVLGLFGYKSPLSVGYRPAGSDSTAWQLRFGNSPVTPDYPAKTALNCSGRLYVTNPLSDRIQYFDLGPQYRAIGCDRPVAIKEPEQSTELSSPTAAEAATYVALGDSYSAGEGVAPYQTGTAKTTRPVNVCHRSTRAYPRLLANRPNVSSSLAHWACSGAIVSDFYARQAKTVYGGGQWREGPQLKRISSAARLVTLTIGGNDAGFADVLSDCAYPKPGKKNCRLRLDRDLRGAIKKLETGQRAFCLPKIAGLPRACSPSAPALHTLYRDIQRSAPNAQVLVLGYPQLFPQDPKSSCSITGNIAKVPRIAVDDMLWLNDMAIVLNRAIRREVKKARAAGVAVRFVDTERAFLRHGVCTRTPWINAARVSFTSISPAGATFDLTRPGADPYSFHPNARGQAKLAELVRKALQ